ncbi:MAG: ankyrin repeat domain-containing protein [Planctomycetaceae bacterium]
MLHVSRFITIAILVCSNACAIASSQFIQAIKNQQWSQAEQLFDAADPNHKLPDGMTALHWAVQHENGKWTERLLHKGADPNVSNDYDVTPLSIACTKQDANMTRALLEAKADPNKRTAGNVACLMQAARSGNVDIIQSLLKHEADVNAKQRNGQTALMWAADAGHAGAVTVLLDARAEIDTKLKSGFNALMFACRAGSTDAAMVLIDRGAKLNYAMSPNKTNDRNPRKGMTALMLTVESAHYDLALKLVERGADPNEQTSGYAPLHALAWVRRPQNGDDAFGDPGPRLAGKTSALQFVKKMVQAGADVNLKLNRGSAGKGKLNPKGATPFLMASQTVDLPYMKLLLELGADPTIQNADGCSALMAAAGIGNHHVGEHPGTVDEVAEAVRWLHSLGLDVNHIDKKRETAMHGAAYRCYPEIIRLLASLGADPAKWDHKNKYGWTPLLIAKGNRPGSVKPDKPTIAAVTKALGNRANAAARQKAPDQKWEPESKPEKSKSRR